MSKHISRRTERKLVAQFLYSLEYVECPSIAKLEEYFIQYLATEENWREYNSEDFSWQLICGVWAKQDKINDIITTLSRNWKLERIGKMELIALRIALYEILYSPEIPKNVVVKEALDIITAFGDTGANTFIVGIIEQVAREREEI